MHRIFIIASALVAWGALALADDDLGEVVTDLEGIYDMQSELTGDHVGWLMATPDGRVLYRDDPHTDGFLDQDEVFYPRATDGLYMSDSNKFIFFKMYEHGLYWHAAETPDKLRDCGPLTSNELTPDS